MTTERDAVARAKSHRSRPGEEAVAVIYAERAIELAPDSSGAWACLAACQRRNQLPAEAVAAAKHSLQIEPALSRNPAGHTVLLAAQVDVGSPDPNLASQLASRTRDGYAQNARGPRTEGARRALSERSVVFASPLNSTRCAGTGLDSWMGSRSNTGRWDESRMPPPSRRTCARVGPWAWTRETDRRNVVSPRVPSTLVGMADVKSVSERPVGSREPAFGDRAETLPLPTRPDPPRPSVAPAIRLGVSARMRPYAIWACQSES